MYEHTINTQIDDDLIYTFSIQEWERLLVSSSAVDEDELPLSYERIAEVIAEEVHKYGLANFNANYGFTEVVGLRIREVTKTTHIQLMPPSKRDRP